MARSKVKKGVVYGPLIFGEVPQIIKQEPSSSKKKGWDPSRPPSMTQEEVYKLGINHAWETGTFTKFIKRQK